MTSRFQNSDHDCSARGGVPEPATAEEPILDPSALDEIRALDPSGQSGLVGRVLALFDSSAVRQRGTSPPRPEPVATWMRFG